MRIDRRLRRLKHLPPSWILQVLHWRTRPAIRRPYSVTGAVIGRESTHVLTLSWTSRGHPLATLATLRQLECLP